MDTIRNFRTSTSFWQFPSWRAKAARQGALLWVLAIATEKQMPLVPALDAFADDARGPWQRKVRELADRIDSGVSLPDALNDIPGVLPANVALAARVGLESGTLGTALRAAAKAFTTKQEAVSTSSAGGVFAYLIFLLFCIVDVVGYVMYYVIPKFKKIFADFGVELPALTVLLINVSDVVVKFFFLFIPLILLLLWTVISCSIGLQSGGMEAWGPFRWMSALFPRLKVPDMLRNLVVVIDAGRPLTGVVSTLAEHHPDEFMRRKFFRINIDIQQGSDCWQSMTEAGLILPREAAILASAQKAGNLAWALKELANRIDRRLEHRMNVWLEFIRPVFVIGFGIVTGFVVIGLFMPLVKLLHDLS